MPFFFFVPYTLAVNAFMSAKYMLIKQWCAQVVPRSGGGGTFGKIFPRNEAVESLASILWFFGEAQTEFRLSAERVSERPWVPWVVGGVSWSELVVKCDL